MNAWPLTVELNLITLRLNGVKREDGDLHIGLIVALGAPIIVLGFVSVTEPFVFRDNPPVIARRELFAGIEALVMPNRPAPAIVKAQEEDAGDEVDQSS